MARLQGLILVAALALPVQGLARPLSTHVPLLQESTHGAVHLPTGCRAEIVLAGRTLIRARITDPDCLPKGVKGRRVPGSLFDFAVTPK